MCPRESLFQLLKLEAGEGRPISPLLPFRRELVSVVTVCGPWRGTLGGWLVSAWQFGGRPRRVVLWGLGDPHGGRVLLVLLRLGEVVWKKKIYMLCKISFFCLKYITKIKWTSSFYLIVIYRLILSMDNLLWSDLLIANQTIRYL